MKCLACGAEMRLLDVRSEATTPLRLNDVSFSVRHVARALSGWGSTAPECPHQLSRRSTRLPSCSNGRVRPRPAWQSCPLQSRNVPSIGMRWLAGSASLSRRKGRKQGLLRGRGQWKSSAVERWRSRTAQSLRGLVTMSSTASGMVSARANQHPSRSLRDLSAPNSARCYPKDREGPSPQSLASATTASVISSKALACDWLGAA